MKRGMLFLAAIVTVFSIYAISACTLNVSMINQDPYPAIPGEAVKIVFQINGVSDPSCGTVTFNVKENFPFTVDPETPNPTVINSGTYVRTYSSFYLAPYKIRVDKDAIDGDNPIEVTYSGPSNVDYLQEFNIYVKNTKADFEVYVKDYNSNTQALTLEILNIEDVDVKAVTVEIPKQENVQVRGANRVVVGDLDSNEYTTAEFDAIMKDGPIVLDVFYTDSANIRRDINKTIIYDSSYFKDLYGNGSSSYWILIVIVLLIVGFFVWRYFRKKKLRRKMPHMAHS